MEDSHWKTSSVTLDQRRHTKVSPLRKKNIHGGNRKEKKVKT